MEQGSSDCVLTVEVQTIGTLCSRVSEQVAQGCGPQLFDRSARARARMARMDRAGALFLNFNVFYVVGLLRGVLRLRQEVPKL